MLPFTQHTVCYSVRLWEALYPCLRIQTECEVRIKPELDTGPSVGALCTCIPTFIHTWGNLGVRIRLYVDARLVNPGGNPGRDGKNIRRSPKRDMNRSSFITFIQATV